MKSAGMVLVLMAVSTGVAFGAADLVIIHAKVFVPQSPQHFADAVAIADGRIVAVGTDGEIAGFEGPHTIQIDARRHLVIPGINDAHVHFQGYPEGFAIPCDEHCSTSAVQAALAASLEETPSDIWVYGTIGPQVLLDPAATKTLFEANGRKVVLREFTGHGLIVNSAALAALDVSPQTRDPIGGTFGRNQDGTLNGKVFEYAEYNLLHKLAELSTDDENIAAIRDLSNQALAFGITTLQVMPWPQAAPFVRLVDRAHAGARIRVMRIPETTPTALRPDNNRSVQIGAVKWLLDGTPIERGAALRQPYGPNLGDGKLDLTEAQIEDVLKDAINHGEQPLFHAAGDRAAAELLKAMTSLNRSDWASKRVRIEHGDGLQPDLIRKAAEYGIVVVQNPTHFTARQFYPATGDYFLLKTLLNRGVHLAFGSDGVLNPFVNIMFAVQHPQVPAEAISVAQAITAYTAGSAYAEKAENKGIILRGQVADLAILSDDLFMTLPIAMPDVHSLMTIVGGRIVYDSGVLPH